MASNYRSSEIVLEFNGDLNQNFLFRPLMEEFRGRWAVARVKLADKGALSSMPDIPGQCICIDTKAKSVRVIDPLSFDSNEQLLATANSILEAKNIGRGKMRARDEISHQNLKDTTLKSLLWHVLEMYDGGNLTVVQGTPPTRKQVLDMPGKLQLRFSTTNQKTNKFTSDEELRDIEERYGIARVGDLQKA